MKRTLAATLLAIILGIAATGAAMAMSHAPVGDGCAHDPTIASLKACVEHMEKEGFIDNTGVVRSLEAKLNAAQAASDREQPDVAISNLEALIHEVEAQAGKHIAEPHAGHLIQHAQLVIDALS